MSGFQLSFPYLSLYHKKRSLYNFKNVGEIFKIQPKTIEKVWGKE